MGANGEAATTAPHASAQSAVSSTFAAGRFRGTWTSGRHSERGTILRASGEWSMNTEDDVRVPASESPEASNRNPESGSVPAATRRGSRTPTVVGSVIVLLLLGAVAYYFVGDNSGTEVAMRASSETTPAATAPPPVENPKSPASSKAAPTPAQPSSAQQPPPSSSHQSASTPAPNTAPTPAAASTPPAATAQESAKAPSSADSKQPTQSAEATPKTEEPRATAPAAPQPSMRDQPAALPDQAAAAPKNETVLVVMRGPANIRSKPGKGGRVVATVAKDSSVKELSRSGKWVEVETDSGTGWIAAALLGAQSSNSR